jgi:hypothetical protein
VNGNKMTNGVVSGRRKMTNAVLPFGSKMTNGVGSEREK